MVLVRGFVIPGALLAATLLCGGCFDDGNPAGADSDTGPKLFVVETDYQSGLLEWMGVESGSISNDNLSIFSDAVVRGFGGYLYILERTGGDNVIKFDPSKSDESGVHYQVHLGDNWNPQDIEFISETKAYIANQDEPKITIFNPATGTVISHIDVASYTFNPDSNSSPHANQMALSDGKLYVMLQRRDGWNPGAPTMILAIDTETDEIAAADTIVCQYTNGYDMICVDGALYVTNPGSLFSTGDGGVEKIDLADKSVSTIVDENELGGNPNQIIHKTGSRFYVQNYIGWQNVSIVEIDVADKTVVTTLPDVKDAFGGMVYDSIEEKLYVGERDSVAVGILVFEDDIQTAGPIRSDKTLPPSGMALIR
ncbi:MAG: hypothetical protein JW913_09115 [Chitinispirillaceae bacterium]|nr:hypothetical protein [Chitinispirillaceae bacterium]